MVEIMLLAVLVMGLLAWLALSIEDERHAARVEAQAPRVTVRVRAEFWEDSLPHRRSLPWQSVAAG